ncbi:MAG: type II toxin-antitoxin system HicA family toxin [Rhodoferax sp.]|nr:type II toxin-antitoxin system HicA family toxin [Rhodoferax sp.]
MKSADIVKKIKADGWFLAHLTVPPPEKGMSLPTARSILKQAGL